MKSVYALGWMGIALLLASASCSHDPEDFCTGWVEDTCTALATCCDSGSRFDAQECRLSLSDQCQQTTRVELVHSGEVVFSGGAASDCFGSIQACTDIQTVQQDVSFEHTKACANVITGYRPPGASCGASRDCEKAGEFATCYSGSSGNPGTGGICAKVVVDEAGCGFSFESSELRICPEGMFCDAFGFTPKSTDPPTIRAYEFSAKCRNDIAAGGSCFNTDGDLLPCATGLFCDVTGAKKGSCAKRKGSGAACNSGNECAEDLFCGPAPKGTGETCQKADVHGPYCFSPSKCGNGKCEAGESVASCPSDCGGGADCGDLFCDVSAGETVTCPQDCCGDGSCDLGETTTCPSDCP